MKTRSPIRVNALAHAKLLRALVDGPGTGHELAEQSGLTYWTVSAHLREFVKERLVHISGWQQDSLGRHQTPIYAWGAGKSTPKIGPLTNAEKCALYRERRKQREMIQRMAGSMKEAA